MKRLKKIALLVLLLALMSGAIYAYISYKNNQNNIVQMETPLEYAEKNQDNEESYYAYLFDQVKSLKRDTLVLLDTEEILITKDHETMNSGYTKDATVEECSGIFISYITIKNKQTTPLTINEDSFYIPLNNTTMYPQTSFDNAEFGKYSIENFPIEIKPNESKDLFLAFEYSVEGKNFDYEATEEEKEQYRYYSNIYYNDEQLSYTSFLIGCVATIRDKN